MTTIQFTIQPNNHHENVHQVDEDNHQTTHERLLANTNSEIENRDNHIDSLQCDLKDKDEKIESLTKAALEKDKTIESKMKEIEEMKKIVEQTKAYASNLHRQVSLSHALFGERFI